MSKEQESREYLSRELHERVYDRWCLDVYKIKATHNQEYFCSVIEKCQEV